LAVVKRLKAAGSRPSIRHNSGDQRIDEGEPAGRSPVPGVGRNLVERGLQLGLERSDVRDVSHDREIYGVRQPLAIANRLVSS
jgi:hypothetical protein